ncbi:PIG-L family deacetylase [Microbacterium sp. MPKO10]|uniref:PIG-L family deacetylase n=1 Tax=Microbacterium sp. MPKO10 TaxID=2989818 RepID=UPI002235524B|nr:PIG-L family deacetylase [Microbacterium sp. MPKO10]MCW4457250.1 PIG-L family deacetylase [Microbacterium sp. MPKO10]
MPRGGTRSEGDESQGPAHGFDTDGTVLDGTRHVLFVHAHPDDETLATGALMAELVERGILVTLVTCTRGERGEVVPGPLSHLEGTPEFATHRENELAGALAELGVTRHVWLGTPPARAAASRPPVSHGEHAASETEAAACPDPKAPGSRSEHSASVAHSDQNASAAEVAACPEPRRYEDSGMRWVREGLAGPAEDASATSLTSQPLDDEVADLLALLDRNSAPARGAESAASTRGAQPTPHTPPDLIVSYNEIGGYGHPDHVRAREIAERAARARGIRFAEIISDASTLQNAQDAGEPNEPHHNALQTRGDADAVGEPSAQPEVKQSAPVETWFRLEHRLGQVKRALAHHASQVTVAGDDVVHSGGQRTPIETSAGLRVLS